jgi:hypothetical protein
MGRESREVWTKRVERWRDSGLSAGEFAAEIGVNANSLRHWGWRVGRGRTGREVASVSKAPLTWVEVAAPTEREERKSEVSVEKLELVLPSGLLVRVPTRFEPEGLRRLLAVVG